jgi:hypothetical protein
MATITSKRAIVAQVGLGANLPEDAIYPLNLGNEAGRPLDGASRYTVSLRQRPPCLDWRVGDAAQLDRLYERG